MRTETSILVVTHPKPGEEGREIESGALEITSQLNGYSQPGGVSGNE